MTQPDNPTIKPIVKIILVAFVTALLWRHFFAKPNGVLDIRNLVKNDALVVDVRSAGEYATGHINGAINIPHHQVAQEIANHESNQGRPIILYCHSGWRSASAKKSLLKAGYTNVVNAGGLRNIQHILK